MENMELKNLELTDDQLEQANGGTPNGNGHEVLFPPVPIKNDDVLVDSIEDLTPSIP